MDKRTIKGNYDAKATRIIATTSDIDRDGEVVSPKGLKNLNQYLSQNPVILWQHRHDQAPVGKATSGRILDNRVELEVEWAPTPMGQEVKALYDGGFMSSFSIGFMPMKSETINGQFTWTEWELLETSAVSIPANPMANIIRSAEENGVQVAELKSLYREASLKSETEAEEVATESDEEAEQPQIDNEEATMADKEFDIEAIRKEAAEAERKRIEKEMAEKAERERVEAMEAELKRLKEKEEAELQRKNIREEKPEIKVGTNPDYKGINLRKGVEVFSQQLERRGFGDASKRAMVNEEKTMGLMRAFHDLYSRSFDRPPETKATDYTSDESGGFLSPDEYGELLYYARLNSVALRDARTVNMTSDVMRMPRENAKVTLGYTNTTTEAGETSATFEQVTLTAGDLDGYADVSMHLEMDSTTPVAALLLDQFTEAYGQSIDSAVFAGTGTPTSGVFLSYGRSEVFGSGSSSFSEILVGNLIAAEGLLEKPRRAGAKWYVGRSTLWTDIYPLRNDNGDHYLITDLSRPGARTLLGYPVEEVEEFPADDASTAMAIYGNLTGFIVGNRLSNLTLFRDPYSRSAEHYVRYVFWTRVAFANALPNNFVGIVTAA